MLLIPCPHCGPRAETEFRCAGEAHVLRPAEPAAVSDIRWTDYLYRRSSPRGRHFERWHHAHGCARFFNVVRDTVTDRIESSYEIGTPPPTKERS